jgi:hypothetical protein
MLLEQPTVASIINGFNMNQNNNRSSLNATLDTWLMQHTLLIVSCYLAYVVCNEENIFYNLEIIGRQNIYLTRTVSSLPSHNTLRHGEVCIELQLVFDSSKHTCKMSSFYIVANMTQNTICIFCYITKCQPMTYHLFLL